MQPKRITAQQAHSQRPHTTFAQSSTKLSAVPTSFHEVTTSYTGSDFQATAFDTQEFGATDLSSMDYSLPDAIDARIFRLTGARTATGQSSSGSASMYLVAKRGVDICVSFVLLVLMSPVLLLLAVLVKASSKGPVFFAHRRLGRDGREFYCLKFRTMIDNAEEHLKRDAQLRQRFEEKFKLEDDPRITPLGAFLRRTSLDELPQLLHVLRGEMSLVGPRPIVEAELSKYSIYAKKLLSVKPGLSGLWQVCGRSDTTYPQRVIMDMHYIDHRCLSLDFRLLVLTASAVVRKSGAC
jgi:lipopolysaccharide/colanic/teichoic acid biosynthesis glycosyltransferase